MATLSGSLIPLALAPFNIWPLGILSIACLGVLINRQDLKTVMWRTWFFGIGMYAVGVSWVYVSISGFGGAPAPLALLLVVIFVLFLAAVFSAPFYIFGRWFSYHRLSLLLIFPVIWLITEWLRTWLLTGFPWLFVGYSQLHTWLSGWAPVLGVLGLSLMSALSAGLLAACYQRIRIGDKKIDEPVVATTVLVSASVIVIAAWLSGLALQSVEWTHAANDPTSIAIVQPNIAQEDKWDEGFEIPTLDMLKEQSGNFSDHKIIIWPEAAVPYIYSDALPFLNEINRKAVDSHTGVITGIIYDDAYKKPGEDVYYNSVVGLGDAMGFYHKRRLVPFGEYVPISWLRNIIEFFNLPTSIISIGPDKQQGLKINNIAIAPSICYEVAYPDLVANGAVGSQLLMSVSNLGWFGDSLGRHQFMQMAQMRALETRHYYAYSTNNGPSAIFDRKGNIVAQTEAFKQTTLSSHIFVTDGSTPFMRWGSVPVVSVCLLILFFLMIGLVKRKKYNPEHVSPN